MTLSAAQRYVNRLTEAGIEAGLYKGYSGRGMFGKETVGVTIDSQYLLDHAQETCPGLTKYSRDSLGLGMIFY